MDFMERLFSQAPGRFHSDPLDRHGPFPGCEAFHGMRPSDDLLEFVAPMEAGASIPIGPEKEPRGTPASTRSSGTNQTASKPLEDDEMDLGNEGFPFSTEDTEERNGR